MLHHCTKLKTTGIHWKARTLGKKGAVKSLFFLKKGVYFYSDEHIKVSVCLYQCCENRGTVLSLN